MRSKKAKIKFSLQKNWTSGLYDSGTDNYLQASNLPWENSQNFVNFKNSGPLDPIQVQKLNLKRILDEYPELEIAINLINNISAFEALFIENAKMPKRANSSRFPTKKCLAGLVEAGLAIPMSHTDAKAVLTAFHVPKSNGLSRFILNGTGINQIQKSPPHFTLPNFDSTRTRIFNFDFATKIDLRHCFYQFPLNSEISKYFTFRENQFYYRFIRMPMGWSYAPFICQEFATTICKAHFGENFEAIYDDWMFLGNDPDNLTVHTKALVDELEFFESTIHDKKSELHPKSEIEFFGVIWDLAQKRHKLADSFLEKWLRWFENVHSLGNQITVRKWFGICSALFYAVRIFLLPPGEFWEVYRWTADLSAKIYHEKIFWDSKIRPWKKVVSTISDFTLILRENRWINFVNLERSDDIIWSDASLSAWAFCLTDQNKNILEHDFGNFVKSDQNDHFSNPEKIRNNGEPIHLLELRAMWNALRCFVPRKINTLWVLKCDNTVALVHLNRLRGSCFLSNKIILEISELLRSYGSAVQVEWVDTKNQIADQWARLGMDE